MNYKHLIKIIRLPYEVKYALYDMYYGHRHFQQVPNDPAFVKFATSTLKIGLHIND